MSRFHFDEAVMSEVAAALSSASGETSVNHTLLLSKLPQVFFQSGFGIENSLSNIQDVMKSDSKLLEKIRNGAETLVKIKDTVSRYDKAAISSDIDSAINYETEGGVCAPKQDNDTELLNKKNTYTIDDVGVRKGTLIYNYWGVDRAVMTDDEGRIFIRKYNGDFYDGYVQGQQVFTHNENSEVECTSTALAQSSTINGITKIANDYNNYNGFTQIEGYKSSSEQLTQYCLDNLKKGLTTVIYYNYSGYNGFGIEYGGHAVTVFGAEPNASSVYDLWVIDPADGQRKKFSELSKYSGGNLYVCYTTYADSTYAGAAAQYHHIDKYYKEHFYI